VTQRGSKGPDASIARICLATLVVALIISTIHFGIPDSWTATAAAAAMLLLPWALMPKDPGPALFGDWKRDIKHTFLWSVATFLPFALAFHIWFSFIGGLSLSPELNASRISKFQPELRSHQHNLLVTSPAKPNEVRIWESAKEIFVFVPKGASEARVDIKPENHEAYAPPTTRRLLRGKLRRKNDRESSAAWGERQLKPGEAFSFPVGASEALHIGNPGADSWTLITPHESLKMEGKSEKSLPKNLMWIPIMFLLHLLAVALPEEYFFRGFVQKHLRNRLPSIKVPLLPGRFPLAIVVSSALFALVHLVATPNATRLAVFFPSLLFGWLYERSGNLSQPIAYHALSNVVLAIYEMIWFG